MRKLKSRWMLASSLAGGVVLSAVAWNGEAFAQVVSTAPVNDPNATTPNPAAPLDTSKTALSSGGDSTAVANEVVVTGTLIRGRAPTGSELVTVTAAQINQLGATDTSQLLSSLPQDSQFNSRPQVGNFGQYQTINAPLLRFLGGANSGSNSTLLLIDGVRLPGMGILQTSADIDAIAPNALERVDIATDGGSATYGADAVGGVVNLITRKKFDGLELGGHYGGADDYNQWDLYGTAGKTWDNASVWLSYDHSHHDLISNNARDYEHDLNYTTTPYTGNEFTCNPGNFIAGGYVATSTPPYYAKVTQTYPIVNGSPVMGTANTCDTSKTKTFFPGEDRDSLVVGSDINLTSWLTFDLRGYYTHRSTDSDTGPNLYEGVPATACVYSAAICSAFHSLTTAGTVSGSFIDSLGPHTYSSTTLDTYAIIPKLTAKFGHDWEGVAFFNAGEGYSRFTGPYEYGDQPALASEVASGAFNPFTGLFASTPAGQAAEAHQANYYGYSSGNDVIYNSRVVFDGPLIDLPGGQVRFAFGGEYLHEDFTQRNGEAEIADFDTIPSHPVSRDTRAGFFELSVPVVGPENRLPGVYAMTWSAAGRYDDYSDFGGTFNPKFGGSWKPLSWWTIRGNWSRSFQAPSLASTASAIPPALVSYPASTFGGNPAYPNTSGLSILTLYPGGGLNLQPQKATTYEVGTDFKPTFLPGLSASLTYYDIDFTNRIATPAFYNSDFYQLYPSSYIINTGAAPFTTAQIQNYVGSAYNANQYAQYINNPNTVYALENALSQNLASTTTSGLDFNFGYEHPIPYGTAFIGWAGTYVLTFDSRATPTSPVQNLPANEVTRLHSATTLGAQVGDLLAKAVWYYTEGFDTPPSAGNAFQAKVGSLSTLNLSFVYTPKWGGYLHGTSVSLNIDNIFDQDPPSYNGAGGAGGYGYYDFTLGRFIEFGIKKTF